MDKDLILDNYEKSKEIYRKYGVDTDKALETLNNIKISLHCWQGDDVKGFLKSENELSGGIMTTGQYPGRARNASELRSDLEMAFSQIPGKHKLNLHAIYADTDDKVDLDAIEPKHFEKWVVWAKQNNLSLDFNPTFFSHPMYKDGFTLAHPDKKVRDFWIEHGKRSRKIGEYFGRELGEVCYTNYWIPDGYKDIPIDTLTPRKRLMDSLDEIFSEKISEKYNIDTVESKLFGIGAESYTVGSHEFYMGYGISRNKTILLDAGHFHPTEVISNKISALSLFSENIMLHVSRPVRWDSDHVVIQDDELKNIAKEIVYNDLLDRTAIGLDFFDATINRIAAWIVGVRNTQKALLESLLSPIEELKKAEYSFDFTKRLVLSEEVKDLPYIDVWNYYCYMNEVDIGLDWYVKVMEYEKKVLKDRGEL